jgi:RNA polymerase sigma-70 factor (ECF subfamily)
MEAFRVLFDRYQPIIFRQALFRTREIDLSHDVVQETFLRIWERRSSLKPHLSFLAYALRISENIVRDTFRHRKTRQRLEGNIPPPALSVGDDPAESLQLTMLQEKLNAVINEGLPERCRLVFTLSRFEGKSNQEIADLLKISVKTVENQIGHALKVMRKKMKGYVK